MKKALLTICVCLLTNGVYAQVGINTERPIGIFHIDGKQDNLSLTHTPEELENDLVFSPTGKLGIGLVPDENDGAVLQLNGPIHIKNAGDIVAGQSYVLGSVQGCGTAKWMKNIVGTPAVIGYCAGTVGGPGENHKGYSGHFMDQSKWIGVSITLPPGSWIIQSAILLYTDKPMPSNTFLWQRLEWSDKIDSQDASKDILTGQYVSGIMPPNSEFGLATGTCLINNQSKADKVYYLNIDFPTPINLKHNIHWKQLGGGIWGENSVVAYPVAAVN